VWGKGDLSDRSFVGCNNTGRVGGICVTWGWGRDALVVDLGVFKPGVLFGMIHYARHSDTTF
jgi:hypothetical protein